MCFYSFRCVTKYVKVSICLSMVKVIGSVKCWTLICLPNALFIVQMAGNNKAIKRLRGNILQMCHHADNSGITW